ncbi:CDP-diacylglycerol--serine O-phosphatidyltransferase [Psittacicella hinzii]|uniref:PLD phosphodiesterase domain-containing protein n=1 Tax=Psittacicella hinzii TaxID=2028575 RepID=A0A3A1YHT6_9GAMM|nr:CDP-diacylglycerol--serine O-phosphatidyltransferase [Psittacicella hinzii]RIY37171.1 hypothetical protein CKF58_05120 [Psittacicella hinzii]
MLNTLINQGYIVDAANISFLLHPEQYQQKLVELISNAKQRILMNCLYLENDESGQVIMDALIAAVKQNPYLHVDIFMDLHRAQRSRMGEQKCQTNAAWYFKQLSQLNQDLVAQHQLARNPINIHGVPCNALELFGVYHVKGYVFDNTLLYSGASINNNYCAYKTYRQDRYQVIVDQDLATAFYNFVMTNFASELPADLAPSALASQAASAIQVFSQKLAAKPDKAQRAIFRKFRQQVLASNQLQYQQVASSQTNRAHNLVPGAVMITPVFGIGKNNPLNQAIFDAIDMARHNINIYTPYFNFNKKLTKHLISQCKKGVKVRIVLSDKVANDFYADPQQENYTSANSLPYLYELNLRKFLLKNQDLINNGSLEVFAWKHDTNSYHAKGLEIDSTVHIWTGSNLNQRSFNIDAENALIVYDPYKQLESKVATETQFMLQHVTKLTSYTQIEQTKDYPVRVKQTLRRAKFFFIDKLAKRLF